MFTWLGIGFTFVRYLFLTCQCVSVLCVCDIIIYNVFNNDIRKLNTHYVFYNLADRCSSIMVINTLIENKMVVNNVDTKNYT